MANLDSLDITPLIKEGTKIITSYSKSSFTIGEEKFEQDIIISASCVRAYKDVSDIAEYLGDAFHVILLYGAKNPEKANDLGSKIRNHFPHHNISTEIMQIGSAARTYNILVAEGRDVIAILELEG